MDRRTTFAATSSAMLLALLSGCATWHSMDTPEKGTAVGATGGALAGAAVGGPVGALVGAGVGGYAGHYEAKPVARAIDEHRANVPASDTGNATAPGSSVQAQPSDRVRAAQQALSHRGYDPGTVDGVMGPNTERALRDFQQAQGIGVTGSLDDATANALGMSH